MDATDDPFPYYDAMPANVAHALDMLLLISPPDGEAYLTELFDRFGGYEPDTLLRLLGEGDERDRLFAILALGYLGTPKAHDTLLPFLQSERRVERWAAAIGLSGMWDDRARPVLHSMLTEFQPLGPHSRGDGAYSDWPAGAPRLLAEWRDPGAAVPLRHALWESRRAELAVPEPPPEEWLVAGRHVNVEPTSDRHYWRRYEDEIVYALGRLGAFGALTGMELPDDVLDEWRVHLVMGYLHSRHDITGIWLWKDNPQLLEDVTQLLEHVFGLSVEERSRCLDAYERSLTSIMLMMRRQREQADKR